MFKIPQTKLNHFSDGPGQELHLPARHTPPPSPPPHPAMHGRVFGLAHPAPELDGGKKNPFVARASCVVSLSRLRFQEGNQEKLKPFLQDSFVRPRFDTLCSPRVSCLVYEHLC